MDKDRAGNKENDLESKGVLAMATSYTEALFIRWLDTIFSVTSWAKAKSLDLSVNRDVNEYIRLIAVNEKMAVFVDMLKYWD